MTYHGGLATHKILILAPLAYNLSPTTLPVFSLPDHALVTLEGPDAVAFAHAQFANDVAALAPGCWQWNAWLTPKGRVIAVFALITIRGFKIAKRATDDLGRYLATGITTTIAAYALINVMVTTGLLPTTGLPMPLISYGGTTIIFTAFAFGILLNISMFTRIRPREISVQPVSSDLRVGEVYK